MLLKSVAILTTVFVVWPGGIEGQVVRRGTCPHIPPSTNFNINQMCGEWYLHSLYYYCPQAFIKCSVYNMSVSTAENGQIIMSFREQFYDEVAKTTRVRDTKKYLQAGNYAVSISEVSTPCFTDVQNCTYVAIGPNNEYFVNYCCKQYKKDFKYETMGVRTRASHPTKELENQIHKEIVRLGLSTEFLYPVDHTCDQKPPQEVVKNKS